MIKFFLNPKNVEHIGALQKGLIKMIIYKQNLGGNQSKITIVLWTFYFDFAREMENTSRGDFGILSLSAQSMQDVTVAKLQSTRVQTPPSPSINCNVLRESLSVDSQNIPCAPQKRFLLCHLLYHDLTGFLWRCFFMCSELEAAELWRGVQPELPDQLHGVLRGHHQRTQWGAPPEDLCSLRRHPGDQDLQGQGLRLRQVQGLINIKTPKLLSVTL